MNRLAYPPPSQPAENSIYEQLLAQIRSCGLQIKPLRRGYYAGETIVREVFGLSGEPLGTEKFLIGASPGGGFAGQVYQAFPKSGVLSESLLEGGNQPVAIKVLRPRNRRKEWFRDLLFRISYLVPYIPRVREETVRAGLIWQELLRLAAQIEFRTGAAVARPLGYFWDEEIKAYAEIHEWINGRSAIYEVGESFSPSPDSGRLPYLTTEMGRKREFMRALVDLCHHMGAIGLGRQYEWYTFVSQANLLTRADSGKGQSEFVAVDFRPGLAILFFLPLSPAHARIILQGLSRGVLVHFDEVDLERLDAFLGAHEEGFASVGNLVLQLKGDHAYCRSRLPDFWHARTRLFTDRQRRQLIKAGIIEDWRKLGKISASESGRLRAGSPRFFVYLLLDHLPLAGQPLFRLLGNEQYRHHVREVLVSRPYRRKAIAAGKANDLLEWENDGRISSARMTRLQTTTPIYLCEKVALSWLPRGLHRFATDPEARRGFAHSLIYPLWICFDGGIRADWLTGVLTQQFQKGMLSPAQYEGLKGQIREERMEAFLRDLGVTLGLEAIAKLLYILLALYGLSTSVYWPLLIALLGPIPPSGLIREVYVLAQFLGDIPQIVKTKDRKLLLARFLGILVAPWRFLGNLFAPLEMSSYYRRMSLLLAHYYISKLVNTIPVLGGEGKLLEYWAFLGLYNWPLSLQRKILRSEVISRQ